MTVTAPIITIDGPSGSGKGTISRALARRLGWHFLDSGALYRAVAWACLARGVDPADSGAAAAVARTARITFTEQAGELQLSVDGTDVSVAIRSEACAAAASVVAAAPEVRAALLEVQRAFARPPGLVADGRDMGTVVFPSAELKVFLDASREERAQRRHKQLKEKGFEATIQDLLRDLEERDRRDRSRAVAPLVPAPDAVVIDSTGRSVDDVLAQVRALARERLGV